MSTDSDGFLSRECPSCGRYFKVKPGEGSDQPISYCPHCGHKGSDCWHTPAQIEYMNAVALNVVVLPEINKLTRGLSLANLGFLKTNISHNISTPPPPPMEVDEPYDIVRFPCCNETVKLNREAHNFCIICGTTYDMKLSESQRIFLSHKGQDKHEVIAFKETLESMGYAPWLDQDAMPAGTPLERGLLQGMKDSCAVVFFITPSFVDAGYLETEINYAIQQKREKGAKFAIITLQFSDKEGKQGTIPELLTPYVWKHPKSQLEALREIIRALPVTAGAVDWREDITGVVSTPKIKSTVSELSNEAKEILKAAANGGGHIRHLRHLGGSGIQAGKIPLMQDASPRAIALWVGGLEDLQRRRYIKDLGHKNELFEVTREGYEAADSLGLNEA